jgi:hypothetical protein
MVRAEVAGAVEVEIAVVAEEIAVETAVVGIVVEGIDDSNW